MYFAYSRFLSLVSTVVVRLFFACVLLHEFLCLGSARIRVCVDAQDLDGFGKMSSNRMKKGVQQRVRNES